MQLILGFYSGIGELVEIVNRVVELEHDGVAAKLQLSNAFLASWQAIYSAFALTVAYLSGRVWVGYAIAGDGLGVDTQGRFLRRKIFAKEEF